jgi:uncharacterized protein
VFPVPLISCSESPDALSKVYYVPGEIERKISTGENVDPVKIPKMPKAEYDSLIKRQYISRIAFGACERPYIAPFMYVFDGNHLYFLSTKYGRKMEYFQNDPRVSVEIEEYAPDLSGFTFVSLQGFLEEVTDPAQKRKVREQFVDMIRERRLSPRVLTAFGHTPQDAPDSIVREERSMVWKLSGVKDIVALKNG